MYRSKANRETVISVGDYFYDMTNKEKWNSYINKEIYTLEYSLTKEALSAFTRNFEQMELSANDIVNNILYIRDYMPKKAKLVFY